MECLVLRLLGYLRTDNDDPYKWFVLFIRCHEVFSVCQKQFDRSMTP